MAQKQCSKCKRFFDEETGFHITSRRYKSQMVEGGVKVYRYRHKQCKECRNVRQREYRTDLKETI